MNINRRDFIKNSAAAGIAVPLFLNESAVAAVLNDTETNGKGNGHNPARNMTSMAIVRDCCLLGTISDSVSPLFKKSYVSYPDLARLGIFLDNGDSYIVDILKKCKEMKGASDLTKRERMQQMLALISGYLAYSSVCDILYAAETSNGALFPEERMIYHDVTLLKASRGTGNRERSHDKREFLALLNALDRRSLIGMHTLRPDLDNVDDWIPKIVEWRKQKDELFANYAAAYCEPEASKIRQYVDKENFYDINNALIKTARSVALGVPHRNSDLQQALTARTHPCTYAKAARNGLQLIQQASDYFTGRTPTMSFG